MTAEAIAVVPATAPSEPAVVARVRLRARRYIAWLHHAWANAPGGLGLAITPAEVDRVLAGGSRDDELAYYDADPHARSLTAALRDTELAFASDPIASRMRRELALAAHELDLLALTVAVEADPWLRRAFGYIHDDATSTLPTPWLARQLFHWPAGTIIGSDSNLVRWRLARPIDAITPWAATAPWVADPLIASAMIRGVVPDIGLGDATRLASPRAPDLCLYPTTLASLLGFVRALEASRAIELAISGPPGAGKRTLATQLCAQLGVPLIVVDAERAGDSATMRDAIVRVIRTARIAGAAVYWNHVDAVAPSDLEPARLAIIGTDRTIPRDPGDGVVRRTVQLPALTQASRVALWSTRSSRPVPPPVLDWPLLPADVARAAAMAAADADAIVDACRNTSRIDTTSLAFPLARPYGWSDLVVQPAVRRHLEELEAQARLRWPVYEEWGFGKHYVMGRGIAAMFAGPSGTGKTMAAQVLARSLGMALYRVDLAGVMSKYIGETEKNLRTVFDACERANVLLFFDEADALFGQRMQAKDAHDRFANIEIDYLLQRMEQFEGLAILATNRKHDIDAAFLRRVRFIIDFLPPDVAERKELWARALPLRTPAGDELVDGVDCAVLAERLEMTGADIKNAATAAAFLARAEQTKIAMRHVIRAARRELAKRGVVLRGELE